MFALAIGRVDVASKRPPPYAEPSWIPVELVFEPGSPAAILAPPPPALEPAQAVPPSAALESIAAAPDLAAAPPVVEDAAPPAPAVLSPAADAGALAPPASADVLGPSTPAEPLASAASAELAGANAERAAALAPAVADVAVPAQAADAAAVPSPPGGASIGAPAVLPAQAPPEVLTSRAPAVAAPTPGPPVESAPSRPPAVLAAPAHPVATSMAGPAAIEPTRPTDALHAASLPAASSTAFEPAQALSGLLEGFDCARINAVYDDADGRVSLSGHLRSREERDRLLARVKETPGVVQVADRDLHVVGEPYCAVLDLLHRPGFERSREQRQTLGAIGEPAQHGVLRFTAGWPLELQFAAPDFDGFVLIDYFTSDGRVYHLFPANAGREEPIRARQRFTVGGATGRGVRATIGPPFGLDMVVAVASSRPLLPGPRPVGEGGTAYLQALDGAIADARRRAPNLRLEYGYYLILTAPQ